MKQAIFILPLIVCVCCSENIHSDSHQNYLVSQEIIAVKYKEPNLNNVKFSYEFGPIEKNQIPMVEAHCTLTNNDDDTLFFLTESCFGWTTNFDLDTANIEVISMIDCNINRPIIKSILPHDSFEFKTHFYLKKIKQEKRILNYFIYQVPSYFDLKKKDLYADLEPFIIQNKSE